MQKRSIGPANSSRASSHADNGVPIRDEWEYELLLDPDVRGSDVTVQTGV
jgi:hypothetical protein